MRDYTIFNFWKHFDIMSKNSLRKNDFLISSISENVLMLRSKTQSALTNLDSKDLPKELIIVPTGFIMSTQEKLWLMFEIDKFMSLKIIKYPPLLNQLLIEIKIVFYITYKIKTF